MFTIEFIACLLGAITLVGAVVALVVTEGHRSLKATEASQQYLSGRIPVQRG